MIEYAVVERFAPGSPESIKFLDENGYVIIANALTQDQSATALGLLWDYLEGLGTGIDRTDPATWDDDRWPTAVHGAILPSFGIGHCAAQWFIRSEPNVAKAFAAIWEDDDLLVSFDGVSLWRPWALNPKWKTGAGGTWFHIDQHPIGRPGKQCVQGLVNLLPTSPATGGNVIIPGTHKTFHKIPEVYEQRISRLPTEVDHFRYPVEDPILKTEKALMCHMEAGDLLLWDSRTIHCSSPSLETPAPSPELMRAASLVCMMPRAKSNERVIAQRKAAVDACISTTNWSDKFINADQFPQILQVENRAKYQWPPVPELSPTQLKMVGWTDDEIAQRAG
jgi:hypothetical protein